MPKPYWKVFFLILRHNFSYIKYENDWWSQLLQSDSYDVLSGKLDLEAVDKNIWSLKDIGYSVVLINKAYMTSYLC